MRERINPLRPGDDDPMLGDHFPQHVFGIYLQGILFRSGDIVDVLFDKIKEFRFGNEIAPVFEVALDLVGADALPRPAFEID